jgi:hypothetical protein
MKRRDEVAQAATATDSGRDTNSVLHAYTCLFSIDLFPTQWRIAMPISRLRKSLSGPVLLGLAAFVLHSGAALAASRENDAQTQARELLARTAKLSAVIAPSAALRNGKSEPVLAPQEQARRLILGAPAGPTRDYAALNAKETPSPNVERPSRRAAEPDAHALAARMIRGGAI